MTLRLIVSQSREQKIPPAPPIKRRKIEEPPKLTEETKRKLILVAVLKTKLWSN